MQGTIATACVPVDCGRMESVETLFRIYLDFHRLK
jgi:hypothetical protein